MASPVTRAVRFLSSVHSGLSTVKAGTDVAQQTFKKSVFTPDRFPYFLGVLAISSFTLGWSSVDKIRDENERKHFASYVEEEQRRRNDPHLVRRRTFYAFHRRTLSQPVSLATSE
ncbi:hypothetical protein MPSEU_000705900 [Mayamaea pseudoterrestris]|nr:hypothetical protein MPSEU_000705900 [Mayamaea pseudoterrestris]